MKCAIDGRETLFKPASPQGRKEGSVRWGRCGHGFFVLRNGKWQVHADQEART